jgi:general secretion pathway protein D
LNYFGRFGNDLDVTATAVAGDSRVHVLSRPRILTSHAKEASIFIGETRPYVTSTSSGYGSVYGGGYSQYQQMQIGINLSVLPFINADGLVVMDIKQRVQNIGEMVKIDNNDVPTTIDREATAYIAVRDRDTVILGGAITDNKTTTHGGVPLLKDIPLLGPLFRSNSGTDGRGELVVLIRPTVLATPEAASAATVVEQDNMPDVRRAERESYEVRQKATDAYQKEYEKQLKKEKSKQKKASTKNDN